MEAAEKDGNFRVTSLHVCNQKNKKKRENTPSFFSSAKCWDFCSFPFLAITFQR